MSKIINCHVPGDCTLQGYAGPAGHGRGSKRNFCKRVKLKLAQFCALSLSILFTGLGGCENHAAPEPNQPPVASAGADTAITLPESTVSLNGTQSADPDGEIKSWLWSVKTKPEAAEVSITSAEQAAATASGLTVAGHYEFELKVTDNDGAESAAVTSVTVNPANVLPQVTTGNTIQYIKLPASSAKLSGSAVDTDGEIVSYLWTQSSHNPVQAVIASPDSSETEVTGLTAAGTYEFTLSATDNAGGIGSAVASVVVSALNQAPTANAGAAQTITLPASSVDLNGSGNDPDGAIAGYAWSVKKQPNGANAILSDAAAASTQVTGLTVSGEYEFELTVTDNEGAKGVSVVKVTVSPKPNEAPVASAGSNQTVTLSTTPVTLDGSASADPDGSGDIASYAWACIGYTPGAGVNNPYNSNGSDVSVSNASAAIASAGLRKAGTYKFRLSVTDKADVTDTKEVTITVQPATVTKNIEITFSPFSWGSSVNLAPAGTPDGGWGDGFESSNFTYTLTDDKGHTTSDFPGGVVNASQYSNDAIVIFTQILYFNGQELGSQSFVLVKTGTIFTDLVDNDIDANNLSNLPLHGETKQMTRVVSEL